MRLVLRDLDSGLFYSKNGWTPSIGLAHKFTDRTEAEEAAKAACLKHAEISILIDGGVIGGSRIQPIQRDDPV